uniref:Methyltransferase-like protein 17, mitochondrial n=1 Tax=Callorhinchus milii TaxID=7868 RepID=V9KZ78_CALMI
MPGLRPLSRTLSSLPSGVKPPHRKHAGISRLPTLRLPPALSQAVQLYLAKHPIPRLRESCRELGNYLWSRKRPVEDRELRVRAAEVETRVRERVSERERGPASGKRFDEETQESAIKREVLKELRRCTYRWIPISYEPQISSIYLATRVDGGYAAITRVLHEIKKRVPEFQPRTLLDFGSGTGTVTWASRLLWGDSLSEFVCVDSSPSMHKVAEFLQGEDQEILRRIYFRHFLPVSPKVQFDVTVSAYSLSELPSLADRLRVVQTLWRKTQQFMVLVENGTREGHKILLEARNTVLNELSEDKTAYIFAPCPHDLTCPKTAEKIPSPCNFQQSYHPLPFSWNRDVHTECFSYLVIRRFPREGGSEGEGEGERGQRRRNRSEV